LPERVCYVTVSDPECCGMCTFSLYNDLYSINLLNFITLAAKTCQLYSQLNCCRQCENR